MLVSVLRSDRRKLWRGAALLLVTGVTAGCSSQSARFGGLDDIFTGSTTNQRQIIDNESQPYPGSAQRVAAAPVTSVPTGPVSRGSLPPVSSQPAAAAMPSSPAAGTAPTMASVQPQLPAEAGDPAGWSRAGGTQVTARQGETVYNLSRRFGVPANVIAKVNGLPEASSLQAGQKLVIPTYVYSNRAPVSAPDNNPNVAGARNPRPGRNPMSPPRCRCRRSRPTRIWLPCRRRRR